MHDNRTCTSILLPSLSPLLISPFLSLLPSPLPLSSSYLPSLLLPSFSLPSPSLLFLSLSLLPSPFSLPSLPFLPSFPTLLLCSHTTYSSTLLLSTGKRGLSSVLTMAVVQDSPPRYTVMCLCCWVDFM